MFYFFMKQIVRKRLSKTGLHGYFRFEDDRGEHIAAV